MISSLMFQGRMRTTSGRRSPIASGDRIGMCVPGSHIPILAPDKVAEVRPDYVLILPWNIRDEIMEQLSFIREWGGRFAARSPELRLFS